jgi:hypothetical protein
LAPKDEAANSYQLGLPLHIYQRGSGCSSHTSRDLFKSWQIFWHNYHKKSITKEDITKGHITKEKNCGSFFLPKLLAYKRKKVTTQIFATVSSA